MADISDKGTPTPELSVPDSHSDTHYGGATPSGWKYKSYKIGPVRLPYYASPKAQLLLVAFVCFLCPGKSKNAALELIHVERTLMMTRNVQRRQWPRWWWTAQCDR